MNEVVDHGVRFGRIAVTLAVKDMARAHDFNVRAFVFADPDGNRIDVGQAI